MSRCRTCGAHIRWALTTSGKRIPLDHEPAPDTGNVLVNPADGTALVLGKLAIGDPSLDPEGSVRYMPHHATCPNWPGKAS